MAGIVADQPVYRSTTCSVYLIWTLCALDIRKGRKNGKEKTNYSVIFLLSDCE